MGAAYAKNAATAVVNAGVNVTQQAFNNCSVYSGADQSILCDAQNCPPGTPSSCIISEIDQTISSTSSVACVQNASASATVSQAVQQSVQQEAAAVSTGFGLGPADASNVVDSTANVTTAINTNFTNQINNVAAASQSVTAVGCTNQVYAITQGITQAMSAQGQQTATEVADATQQVTQTISQKATAVNLGGLIIVIVIIVIVIVVGYSLTKVETQAMKTGGKILIPLALLAAGYLLTAYFVKIWPFHGKTPVESPIDINPGYLPPVSEGSQYSATLTATGGTAPYTWSVVGETSATQLSEVLHLSLNPITGVLSGTVPSTPSAYNVIFTAYVADSSSPTQYGAQTYNLQVAGEPLTMSMSPSTMPTATPGQPYGSVQFSASGGTPNPGASQVPGAQKQPTTPGYIYNVYDPNQEFYPLGLSLNQYGLLSGTVSSNAKGPSATFWVYAQDDAGTSTTPFNFGGMQVTIPIAQ